MFSAEPGAIYTYLHMFSFVSYLMLGFTALFFDRGPMKIVRPNSKSTLTRLTITGKAAARSFIAKCRKYCEYLYMGFFQWPVQPLWMRSKHWSRWISWVKLLPSPSFSGARSMMRNLSLGDLRKHGRKLTSEDDTSPLKRSEVREGEPVFSFPAQGKTVLRHRRTKSDESITSSNLFDSFSYDDDVDNDESEDSDFPPLPPSLFYSRSEWRVCH